jgi:putative sterol carrier protein
LSPVFWTEDFFKQAENLLNDDAKLAGTLAGIETSILLRCENRDTSFVVKLASGRVLTKTADPQEKAEFTLSASYEEWVKIANGQEKAQREIVRGKMKFTGSWPKMLLYINKVVRLENEMLGKIGLMAVQY